MPSIRRAVRIDASASACRPPRYWASARISHRRSRNGSSPAATAAARRHAAVVPHVEARQEQVLHHGEPELGQPGGLQPSGLPLLELGERPPVPQAEGLLEERHRPLGGIRVGVLAAPRHQRLELLTVDVDRLGRTR